MKPLLAIFIIVLCALLVTLCTIPIFAQKALPADVVKSIEIRIANGYNPSIAIGIIDKDGPQYYLFGTKTDGGQPVDEHTIYEIGSISKTFTGILLAQAILDGQVKADDPAQNHLPSTVKLPTKDGKQITLGHLSDHTSALAPMPNNLTPKDPANPYADYTVEQMYTFINGYTLPRVIGSKYEYSNLAQGLLGHILSLKAGTSYEALTLSKIANPLGMKETKITFDDKMKQNLAMGYSHGEQVSNWDIPTLAGAGAIRSSVHDMLIYLQANMGLKKSKLYPAMQLSHQVRHDKVGGGTRVGLGWHISKGADGDVIWHNGGTGGYRSFAGFVKETGKGVVVLTNSDEDADDLGFHLLDSEAKLIEVTVPMKVAESVLESYVGVYELAPNFTITITRNGTQLFGQATGQGQFELFAKSATEFFLKIVEAQVTFSVKDNKVESMTLFQGGQVLPGKKIK